MAFGIYIHIPYCVQRCSYCDFATYEQSRIMPQDDYVELLKKEIRTYAPTIKNKQLDTIYFGGGTPSLLNASSIVTILDEIAKNGFVIKSNAEVTIEINPATITPEKLEVYLDRGINRFSVGAQTFNDRLLKKIGRIHSSLDIRNTIDLLASRKLNYSFDLIYSLPDQSIEDFENDLMVVQQLKPKHLSLYNLTLPETHPLNSGRPDDETQIKMFECIDDYLLQIGLLPYEISNYAVPNFESQHNLLYWKDHEYWGIGSGAHSYLKVPEPWGVRFSNPSDINEYAQQIKNLKQVNLPYFSRLDSQFEVLAPYQAMTDYCHISFRLIRGMHKRDLEQKFPTKLVQLIIERIKKLLDQGLVCLVNDSWHLTKKGRILNNLILQELTFLKQDI